MIKKFYSVEEIREIIPMSKAGIYLALAENKIPSIKIGRRILVPAWWVDTVTEKPFTPDASNDRAAR